MAETLRDVLRRAAETTKCGEGIRFMMGRDEPIHVTWTQVHERARNVAVALRAGGVRTGDRVGLVLPTSPEFIDTLFGCILAGAVPVPLYPPIRLGRLEEYYNRTAAMLRAVNARLLVADGKVCHLLGQVLARYRPPLGLLTAHRLAGSSSGTSGVDVKAKADDLALIQFSSGTTVDPKPVALQHAAIVSNVKAFIETLSTVDSEVPHSAVSWLPLYHDMGLIGTIFGSAYYACNLTLIPPERFLARPALWLQAISRYRGTVSAAPDFAYALCADRVRDEDLEGCDLSTWCLALNGAEHVSGATMRRFAERFAHWGLPPFALTPVYGLAESTLAVTISAVDAPFESRSMSRQALAANRAEAGDDVEVVSVGHPVGGMQVVVRDELGRTLDEDRVGRIWLRGPSLMNGYFGRTDSPLLDGWLDTGDVGFLQQGKLYITGRIKDAIILRGANHLPHDIERAVNVVDGVRTGCVAAVGDVSCDGERLVIFVEVRAPRDHLSEDCQRAVLGATGLESQIVLLSPGTIPRTSSGKIRRAETLRQWHAGTLAPSAAVTALSLGRAMVDSALGYWQSHAKRHPR